MTAPGEFWETHEEEIFGMLQTARLGEEKGNAKKRHPDSLRMPF